MGGETIGLGGDGGFSTDFATSFSEKVFNRITLMSALNWIYDYQYILL